MNLDKTEFMSFNLEDAISLNDKLLKLVDQFIYIKKCFYGIIDNIATRPGWIPAA